jgi:hypothetical protein
MNSERFGMTPEERAMISRLRAAARSSAAPAELQVKIRRRLEDAAGDRRPWPARLAWPWVAITAAIGFGLAVSYQLGHFRFSAGQQETFMSSLLRKVSLPLRPGLDDHLHCSVYGQIPRNIPPLEEAVKYLPPQFRELLTIVQRTAPAPFRIYSAHECLRHGRRFVHFQLKTDSKLLSVIVTRRDIEESFVREKIVPALAAAGTPIYQAQALTFQIAAIETRSHLAFVVSDLSAGQNLSIMAAMAPSVRGFLAKLEG